MKLKHLITGFVALAVAASGLFVPAAAAGASDATLSSFDILDNNSSTYMSPSFSPTITSYAFATYEEQFEISANTNDENASVVIVENSVSTPLIRDQYTTITALTGSHDYEVIVTAEDGTTTKTYSLRVAVRTALTPVIHGLSQNEGGVLGGERVTVTLENWVTERYVTNTWRSNNCYNDVQFGSRSVSSLYEYIDSTTGFKKMVFTVPATDLEAGSTVDVQITSRCYFGAYDYEDFTSTVSSKDAFTYLPLKLDSAVVPDVLYPGESFTLNGFGFNSGMEVSARIVDPSDPSNYRSLSRWGYTGNETVDFYLRLYRDLGYEGPANINIYSCVGEGCDYENPIFTDTVEIRQPTPQNITFTPGSMNTAGGKDVSVSGRFLYLGEDDPDFFLNDIELVSEANQLAYEGDYALYKTGMDRYTVTMPENLAPGEYTLSVKNENDLVGTAAAKFVVGAKPAISSITPNNVSNLGGSVVTINGENFGTRGTPTVTINGLKALNVKRVSATKVLATLPAFTAVTGAVNVIVVSPQNGGASDASVLTLAAASLNPTVSTLSVTTGISTGGTEVILTGTNLGALATTGVTVGGKTARIVTASATSLKIQTPANTAGTADVIVSTSAGQVTRAAAFTYTAAPAITLLSQKSFPSSTAVEEAVLTLTGVGFGASGTIKIGANAPIAYTSTNGSTTIENVSVAGQPIGRVTVVVTPLGAAKALTTSFVVTAPAINYVGPDDYDSRFENPNIDESYRGGILNVTSTEGTLVRVEGSGFGGSGHIMVGDTRVESESWDTSEITFFAPALEKGQYEVKVVPAVGMSVSRAIGLIYTVSINRPEILHAEATVFPALDGQSYLQYRNQFDPRDAAMSNRYRIVGSGFLGTDNGASTVVMMMEIYAYGPDGGLRMPVTVVSKTDTEIVIDISRDTEYSYYKSIRVVTNAGTAFLYKAIDYTNSNVSNVIQYRYEGSCLKDPVGLVLDDGWFYADSNDGANVFGESGTVTIGDDSERITVNGTFYSTAVSVYLGNQTVQLENPYGQKTIIVTPDDPTLDVREFSFGCRVYPEVELKINGTTDPVVQSVRDPYTVTATPTKNVYSDSPIAIPDTAYEYMSVENLEAYGYWSGTAGLPTAAGRYTIKLVGTHESITKDADKYMHVTSTNTLDLTLTGSPVTLTPVLVGGGGTVEFRGQLGDGTEGSPDDLDFTSTTVADEITSVRWEYRDHVCETNNYGDNQNWYGGLPSWAARSDMCGGNGNTPSSWDIRVAGITMDKDGVDQSIYYQLTREVFNLTITPKDITLIPRNMDKPYDGSTSANFWYNYDFDGAIENYTPYINWVEANFEDEIPGVNKTINLSGPLALDPGWAYVYRLTNADAIFTATIFKASAYMKLTGAGAVTLDSGATVDISVENRDLENGNDVSGAQDIAPVVLASATPSVCSISESTVTPLAAGECIIEATQASSTYFNAGVADSDNDLLVETHTIIVVGTPVAINVIADDISVPVGSKIDPSVQILGTFGDDTMDSIEFEYYLDGVLVDGVPTERGTYTIMPKGGSVSAFDSSAYDLEGTVYVAGTLTITGLPPTIISVDPASGSTAGGNTLTITGYELDAVTMITIGETVLEPTDFVVSADGNTITLIVPAGAEGTVDLIITIDDASVTEAYTYIAPETPEVDPTLELRLKLAVGAKLNGSDATISGGGLKPFSTYTLTMNSTPFLIYTGETDADGNFSELVNIPRGACVTAGQHRLLLQGIAPDDTVSSATQWLLLDGNCTVQERSALGPIKKASIGKLLFNYRSAVLTKKAKQTLWAMMPLLRKSKTIQVYGYTQTQNKSAASKIANIQLAKQRTYAIAKFLKYVGIKAKVVVRPKGPVSPVSNWQKYNRRVELTISL